MRRFLVCGFRVNFMQHVAEICRAPAPAESDFKSTLSYYCARYYDPAAGRFIREDPVGLTRGPNFYIYAFNSPINLIDPTGMDAVCSTHWVFTWCSWWWPGSEQPSDDFKQSAYTHEMQHQSDNFLLSVVIGGGAPAADALANLAGTVPAACRVLEGRAFAEEVRYLNNRIQALRTKKHICEAEKKELDDLNQLLQTATANTDPFVLKQYCSRK
jgi:RHS repeat-associated protein